MKILVSTFDVSTLTHTQTDRQTDRQADRQTDRHPVGCSSLQTGVCLLVRHKQETG